MLPEAPPRDRRSTTMSLVLCSAGSAQLRLTFHCCVGCVVGGMRGQRQLVQQLWVSDFEVLTPRKGNCVRRKPFRVLSMPCAVACLVDWSDYPLIQNVLYLYVGLIRRNYLLP